MKRVLGLLGRLLAGWALAGVLRPWSRRPAAEVGATGPVPAAPPRPAKEPRPGWSRSKPETLPHPTYWPLLVALGVAFLGWGLISTRFVLGLGLIFFVSGAVGWIGELIDEA